MPLTLEDYQPFTNIFTGPTFFSVGGSRLYALWQHHVGKSDAHIVNVDPGLLHTFYQHIWLLYKWEILEHGVKHEPTMIYKL